MTTSNPRLMGILVSRFPGYVTPGALPLLPVAVSLHPHRLKPGTWIVFRWFVDGDRPHHQSAPEFCTTLEDALELVPDGYALDLSCPEEFAPICYVVYQPAQIDENAL